jgi:Putative addiction module component
MNVETTIDIEQMTVTDKIRLMELLWRDISKDPNNVEVPDWQRKLLEDRDQALANGKTEFIDFEDAVAEIRQRAAVIRRNK